MLRRHHQLYSGAALVEARAEGAVKVSRQRGSSDGFADGGRWRACRASRCASVGQQHICGPIKPNQSFKADGFAAAKLQRWGANAALLAHPRFAYFASGARSGNDNEHVGHGASTCLARRRSAQDTTGDPTRGHSCNRRAANPFSYGWRESTDALVEDALEELVSFLEPHRDFLTGLAKGDHVRIWASTSSPRNYTLDLASSMLARIASLGASLIHDVY